MGLSVPRRPPSALPTARAKWAACKAGKGRFRLGCIGDSTTAGLGAGGTTLANSYPYKPNSYPTQLAAWLAAKGFPARACSIFGDNNVAGGDQPTMVKYDPRLTGMGANWYAATEGAGWGNCISQPSPSTSLFPYALAETCDSYAITYRAYQDGGVLAGNIDGGADLFVQPTYSSTGVGVITGTFARGAGHTFNIYRKSNGAVYVFSMEFWDSQAPDVSVLNMGVSGAKALLLQGVVFPTATLAQQFAAVAPDLVLYAMCINDWNQQTPQDQFRAAVEQGIDMMRAAGSDVVMMLSAPTGNVSVDRMNQYMAIHRQVAYARGIPIIDLYGFFGSYDAANAAGYMADSAHCTGTGSNGYGAEVAIIGPALLSVLN